MLNRILFLPALVLCLVCSRVGTSSAATWLDGVWGPDSETIVAKMEPNLPPAERKALAAEFAKGVPRHMRVDTAEGTVMTASDDGVSKPAIVKRETPDPDTILLHGKSKAGDSCVIEWKRLPDGAIGMVTSSAAPASGVTSSDGKNVLPWVRR